MITKADIIDVELNTFEREFANAMGDARTEYHKRNRTKPSKIGWQGQNFIVRNGAAGEVIFGKKYNYYPDTSDAPKKIDFYFRLASGYVLTIDVKTTEYFSGKLLVPKCKQVSDVDCYVLVTGQDQIFRIIGWMHTIDVFRPEKLKNPCRFGGELCYCIEQKYLEPMNTLKHQAMSLESIDDAQWQEYIQSLPPEQQYSPTLINARKPRLKLV